MLETMRKMRPGFHALGGKIELTVLLGRMKLVAAIDGEKAAAEKLAAVYRFGDDTSKKLALKTTVNLLAKTRLGNSRGEYLLDLFKQGLNDPNQEVTMTLLTTYFRTRKQAQEANQVWPGNLPAIGWVAYRLRDISLLRGAEALVEKQTGL